MHINEFLREINRGLVSVQYVGSERLYGRYSIVYYPAGEEEAAKLVQSAAERFFPRVAAEFGLKLTRRVPVVIYREQSELNRFFGWPADEGTMGVYWAGTLRVLSPASWVLETGPDFQDTFFRTGPMVHEAAHLMVDYQTRSNYPRWFTEGLAQEIEQRLTGFVFEPPDSFTGWYPFSALERFDSLPDQQLAYYQSLLMVRYLYQQGGETMMSEILSDLAGGFSFTQVVNRNLGFNRCEFEANWRQWVDKAG
jgi:hypothetical protein